MVSIVVRRFEVCGDGTLHTFSNEYSACYPYYRTLLNQVNRIYTSCTDYLNIMSFWLDFYKTIGWNIKWFKLTPAIHGECSIASPLIYN